MSIVRTVVVGDAPSKPTDFPAAPEAMQIPFGGAHSMVFCSLAEAVAVNRVYRMDETTEPFISLALAIRMANGGLIGTFLPLSATLAREFAYSLLKLADQLDEGKGKS